MIPFDQLSFWEKSSYLENIDFLIIGSGIVGLSTAIHLKEAQPDKKVLILERGYLPSGGSTKNAGFCCLGSPTEILADLHSNKKISKESNNQNEDLIWETYQKRFQGLQYLREMLGDEAIDYQEQGSFEIFRSSDQQTYRNCLDQLDELNEKIEMITGVKENFKADKSILDNSEMKGFCGAISIKSEGMIDTGKMMEALIKKAVGLGVLILNGIEVKDIANNQISKKPNNQIMQDVRLSDDKVLRRCSQTVTTSYGSISVAKVAVCNNGLASRLLTTLAPTQTVYPVRAQVVVTSPIEDLPFKGTFHFDKGFYYFRSVGDRVLFGGGRNQAFEAEETDELNTSDQIINHLSSTLEEKILPHRAFTIDYHWAGTMGVGPVKAPITEKLSDQLYCGIRMGGMGVAIGSLVGKELADLMKK